MASEFADGRDGGARGRRRGRPDEEPAPDIDTDALRRLVVDAVTEKLAEKLADSATRQADRIAAKVTRHAAHLDRLAERLDALDVWTRAEPGRRRPRFSRAEIAAVALRLADDEGLDAVSMRRIAQELGAGTMTLYHYVHTKDELFALLFDAVMGEMVLGDDEPLPDDWRAGLSVIACRSRDCMRRHPWMLDITDDPPIGPNSVRHFDQSMGAVSGLDVDLADKVELISAVDEYVFGFCLRERNELRADAGGGADRAMLAYIDELVSTGDYPVLRRLREDGGLPELWRISQQRLSEPDRFERTLHRLLDGFARDFERGRARG